MEPSKALSTSPTEIVSAARESVYPPVFPRVDDTSSAALRLRMSCSKYASDTPCSVASKDSETGPSAWRTANSTTAFSPYLPFVDNFISISYRFTSD